MFRNYSADFLKNVIISFEQLILYNRTQERIMAFMQFSYVQKINVRLEIVNVLEDEDEDDRESKFGTFYSAFYDVILPLFEFFTTKFLVL